MMFKINLVGEIEFIKTIKNPDKLFSNDYCNLLQGAEGNMYEVALEGDSVSRALLIKYSPQGDTIATHKYYSILFPALQYFVPRVIRQRQDGGFAILFGHESILGIDFDISLLLLDSLYNIEQYKILGSSPLQETATALVLDDDGGYIVGANRANSNYVTKNFTNRTLIIKTNATGSPVWQWLSPQGQLWGEAEAMFKTSDGGLVVASRRGTEVYVNPLDDIIEWDANVFKLDADRNMVWSTPLRGYTPSPTTGLVEMVEAMDGSGYVVTGFAADSISGPSSGFGCWLAKVSTDGDSLWARYYSWIDGANLNPEPWALAATPDGGYIVAGTTLKAGLPIPGWVLKLDQYGCLVPGCQTTATTEQAGNPASIHLSIYPNPTSDYLNFIARAANPAIPATFRIISSEGRLFREFKTANLQPTFVVPVADCPSGAYWLQLAVDGVVVQSEKFIKQ
jgi:hypothetical protein